MKMAKANVRVIWTAVLLAHLAQIVYDQITQGCYLEQNPLMKLIQAAKK